MARVPTRGRVVEEAPAPATYQKEGAPVEAFGAGEGAAISQLGSFIEANTLRMKDEDDARQAKDLSVAFSRELRQITLGDAERPGYYDNKGQDAITNYDGVRKQIQDLKKSYLTMGKNAQIQRLLEDQLGRQIETEEGSLARYVARERQSAKLVTSKASFTEATDQGSAFYSDLTKLGLAEAQARAASIQLHSDEGLEAEALDSAVETDMSDFTQSVVASALSQGDIEFADQYFSSREDEINADTKIRLRSAIKTRKRELEIETARAEKERQQLLQTQAENELTSLLMDGSLTDADIRNREAVLGDKFKEWGKFYNNLQKTKKTGPTKSDFDVNANLSIEAMTMAADVSDEELQEFRVKVAEEVSKGTLLPKDARTIISDAENARKIDPLRKTDIGNVVTFLKNDFNNEMFGEVDTPEARAEFNRQVLSLNRWARSNPDKDPIEYYEKIAEPYKTERLWGLLVTEETDPVKRRAEIELESNREKARKILRDAGKPATKANIDYVMERL